MVVRKTSVFTAKREEVFKRLQRLETTTAYRCSVCDFYACRKKPRFFMEGRSGFFILF